MGDTRTATNRKKHFKRALLAQRIPLRSLTRETRDALAAPTTVAFEDQAWVLHDQAVVLQAREIDLQKQRMIDAAM